MSVREACRHALQSAKRSDVSKATDTMAESSLVEALAPDVSLLILNNSARAIPRANLSASYPSAQLPELTTCAQPVEDHGQSGLPGHSLLQMWCDWAWASQEGNARDEARLKEKLQAQLLIRL